MRKEDFIKYALIAGGAYLAYVYLKNSGLWDQWFGTAVAATPVLPAGTQSPAIVAGDAAAIAAAATAKAAADAATAAAAASAHTAATIDESKLMRAAANASWASDATGALLNWDEWNWYLAKYATVNNTPPQASYTAEQVGLSRPLAPITASQYHSLKTAKGLEGLAPALPYGRVWGVN